VGESPRSHLPGYKLGGTSEPDRGSVLLAALAELGTRRAGSSPGVRRCPRWDHPLSKDDNSALSRAFYERFGPILQRFGHDVTPDTFAWNTRAALDYHRQVLEHITGITKKL